MSFFKVSAWSASAAAVVDREFKPRRDEIQQLQTRYDALAKQIQDTQKVADQKALAALGILTVDGPCHAVAALADSIVVETEHGHHAFDSVYPALGSDVHTELAGQIGVALSGETGCILTDAHQRTNVPGAYAAGDVVFGLDQISHAMGEGGVAATTIRNDLARERPLLR
jgi:thioredoxin reductase (NADPH)